MEREDCGAGPQGPESKDAESSYNDEAFQRELEEVLSLLYMSRRAVGWNALSQRESRASENAEEVEQARKAWKPMPKASKDFHASIPQAAPGDRGEPPGDEGSGLEEPDLEGLDDVPVF